MTTPQDPDEPRQPEPSGPPSGPPPDPEESTPPVWGGAPQPPDPDREPPAPDWGTTPLPPEDGAPPPAYGTAPPPPGRGAPPPPVYGTAPAPGYATDWGAGGTVPAGVVLADWPLRAQSALVDWFGPGLVVGLLTSGAGYDSGLAALLSLASLAWALYNGYLGGSTGQSYGKRWAGTRVVRSSDGQLIGGGMGVLRYILHIVDALPCYLGFLWPLWDRQRQTFADKIVSTYVIRV